MSTVLQLIAQSRHTHIPAAIEWLDAAGRKELQAELTARVRKFGEWRFATDHRHEITGLRVAGALCHGGAGQVATWLNRRELREPADAWADAKTVAGALRGRPLEWRADLARRLTAALRPPRGSSWSWRRQGGPPGFALARTMLLETGVEPEGDAFTVCWAWHAFVTGDLRNDPIAETMVPRLFDTEGASAPFRSTWESAAVTAFVDALHAEVKRGRLDRATVLDGTIGRFLIGGEARDLGMFVELRRRFEPGPDETPARDLVRCLPAGAANVADLAVGELRALDLAGRLDAGLFGEAVGALALRAEKKHVGAALKWISDTFKVTAADPVRAEGALLALADVFSAESSATRARAIRLAVKLGPSTETARAAVADAAVRLPADERAPLAERFGVTETAEEEVFTGVPLVSAPPLQPPIRTVPELVIELHDVQHTDDMDTFERVMAALVELSHHDRAAMVAGFKADFQPTAWEYFRTSGYVPDDPGWLLFWAAALIGEHADEGFRAKARKLLGLNPSFLDRLKHLALPPRDPDRGRTTPHARLFRQRALELVRMAAEGETRPCLLATPTLPGHLVDPETLLTRLEALGDREPFPADLTQALLRLPRDVDASVADRAEKIGGHGGRMVAEWIREGGLPDPVVEWTVKVTDRHGWIQRQPVVTMNPGRRLPDHISTLVTLSPDDEFNYWVRSRDIWAGTLPNHPEATAAYLLRWICVWADQSDPSGEAVIPLAVAPGPVGPLVAAAVVGAMGHQRAVQRSAAGEAFLALAGRPDFPAEGVGDAIRRLVTGDVLKLSRITEVLGQSADAGAHAAVWEVLSVALPGLLPDEGAKPRSGLGELLGVAVKAARVCGAKGKVPGLAELAARKGSSRVTMEARTLVKQLAD
ncbi:DUF6493 family protein [Herbidospora sp. NBRC 101105]|uniref:DUF6493 family protein n=1 Tax=Herbidospora sp. NBRC 101105 TaxID=3032195 RepID=UPI0024A1A09D|nr:DUF6493 family protein [Herbidospora sp. NBRC 101105]GLX93448.1 hypothetical protein Hesp01_13980 [Herbidospora sp. NBRC 101105]